MTFWHAEASALLSADQARATMSRVCPPSVASSSPWRMSHSRISGVCLSPRWPEASVLPSGDQATARTWRSWPASVLIGRHGLTPHIPTVPSPEPVASILLSGDQTTA